METFACILLAGGSGTRLWPLSDERRPKHLLRLVGDSSLLQQSVRRLIAFLPPDRLWVVTHEKQAAETARQIRDIADFPDENLLAEPFARNTLPTVVWAALAISEKIPEAVVGVFPADHLITDQDAFQGDLNRALALAERGFLVTFGIRPSSPETGFGYIRSGKPTDFGGFLVDAFLEKPDRNIAQELHRQGNCFWNSGVFVFKASVFLEEVRRLQPRLWEALKPLAKSTNSDLILNTYRSLSPMAIDVGIMEKSDKVAVIPASFGWSDLGSWKSVYQVSPKDADGNAVKGNVVLESTKNSLLWSQKGLLAAVGLENMVVLRSGDSVLVCARDRAQDVKKVAERSNEANREDTPRPWGRFTVLEEGPGYKIKRIVVEPGQKLSLQSHEHRAEHWVVIQGAARVTNGEAVTLLHESESTFIPKGQKHRLENAGDSPLVIVEVQTGQYLGEDDIRRFDDIYGRKREI
jgi:mannose-1-phosphate guanylyltransferase/mannose-6-phosphate isomerase